ncbi:MAG: transposase, partial [Bacteroidia bacterium]
MATNIINTVKKYDTQAKCLSYLQKLRWGKTVKCPICLKNKVRSVGTKQGQYFCKICKEQFSIFTGTIFEG